jgi:hypothetical protein
MITWLPVLLPAMLSVVAKVAMPSGRHRPPPVTSALRWSGLLSLAATQMALLLVFSLAHFHGVIVAECGLLASIADYPVPSLAPVTSAYYFNSYTASRAFVLLRHRWCQAQGWAVHPSGPQRGGGKRMGLEPKRPPVQGTAKERGIARVASCCAALSTCAC